MSPQRAAAATVLAALLLAGCDPATRPTLGPEPSPTAAPVLKVTRRYERADGLLCVEARDHSPQDRFLRMCLDPAEPENVAWWRAQRVGRPYVEGTA